jgi:hypothetical protein
MFLTVRRQSKVSAWLALIVSKESPVKNPLEVLRMKEQEILRVKREIEALRITAKLLGEEPPSVGDGKVELRQVVNMP